MNNHQATGYMIMAARRAELSIEQIKQLEFLMKEEMDFSTEEEAERAYNTF